MAVSVARPNPYGYTQGWHGLLRLPAAWGRRPDYLMLMTYDEHYQGGSPGPVASRAFQEQSIQYAPQVRPRRTKLVLGLPFFGRIWSDSGTPHAGPRDQREPDPGPDCQLPGPGDPGRRLRLRIRPDHRERRRPQPVINGVTLTAGTYTIWYESEQSKKYQLSLVEEYGLLGGGEPGAWARRTPRVWDYYSLWLNGLDL